MGSIWKSCAPSLLAVACAACGGGGRGRSVESATYTLGGTVTGLAGSGLTIRNNTTDLTIHGNGSFAFSQALANGTMYGVTVITQPSTPAQVCTVSNGSGVVSGGNVTNVTIMCPPSTDKSWGTAGPIGTTDMGSASGLQPEIAFDTNGNALAVWGQSDGTHFTIWANRYTPGSGWGDAQPIEPVTAGDAFNPQIAFDKNGNALAVWYQDGGAGTERRIWSNHYSSTAGLWDGAQQIENVAGNASNPQIAIDAHGNALAVWQQFDGAQFRSGIWSNLYTVAGGWDRTQARLISIDDVGSAGDPQIAFDADGNALAVWTSSGIRSNRYSVATGWGATSELISTGAAEVAPQIAFDAHGNALTVWYQFDGLHSILWANRYAAGVGWSAAAQIQTGITGDLYPRLAVDSQGNALAVWNQLDGTHSSIWSKRYSADGGWNAAEPIETNTGDAFVPQLAFDADGNALAVWAQFAGAHEHIWSSRYRVGNGWGIAAPIELDTADRSTNARIAIDGHGNALAVWQVQQPDGTHGRVWSNRFE